MTILHLSYVHVPMFKDPLEWLKRINFFVLLLEKMAEQNSVESIHCIGCTGSLLKHKVKYSFFDYDRIKVLFPKGIHDRIKTVRPDIVLVHGFHYPWQLLLLRLFAPGNYKIFVQHHSEKPLQHYKALLQRMADALVTGYFFPSLDQARPWIEKKQIQSLQKVHEVMEAPSAFYYQDRDVARSVTKLKGGKVYLWVGRLEANKDPVTLMQAFIRFSKANPSATLYVIYQQDLLLGSVKNIIERSGSTQIVLIGKIPHADLQHWYNSADFIISTSHYEGMGVSVAEALSCGCIPILTRIHSFVKMTPHPMHHLLFEAGNVDDLYEALLRSDQMEITTARTMVRDHYQQNLSVEAINGRMLSVFAEMSKT